MLEPSPRCVAVLLALLAASCATSAPQRVQLSDLLREMSDRAVLARLPEPPFTALQASSYNRESTAPDAPGWFADSDGTGFVREEERGGVREWVAMEHDGPGVITRLWAPCFYYGGLDDLEGPNIAIYLDGSSEPVLRENFFRLLTGRGSVPPPLALRTARAGDCYLPIAFAKSCKVTFDRRPFYNVVEYRAYPPGTNVETFTRGALEDALRDLDAVASSLQSRHANVDGREVEVSGRIEPNGELALDLKGSRALYEFELQLDPREVSAHPELLRSTVLAFEFDGEECVWVPLGDFFASANELHPFSTWTCSVRASGVLTTTWVMPFERAARLRVLELGSRALETCRLRARVGAWSWDERSLHFHADWRPDEVLDGATIRDWKFVEVRGDGVLVGDALTVLCPDLGWWGEGDEKIWVDGDFERRFPGHFGTGTEDYYGWAGGENPLKDDRFSAPFCANVEVGSATRTRQGVRGFNVCARARSLDAIPFRQHLRFDMEASPGVQIRRASDHLGYSAVTYWYARPGARSNRGAQPEAARRTLMQLEELDRLAAQAQANR